MANVFDFANLLIDTAVKCDDEPMTNMRLNKLLYFAQGHSLARRGVPLFSDEFEAWDNGPVVRDIYAKYKHCQAGMLSADSDYSENIFTPDERDLLLDVMETYSDYSTYKLVAITHENGSPWSCAYKKGGLYNPILQDTMRDWFSRPECKLRTVDEIMCAWREKRPPVRELPIEMYHPEDDQVWEDLLRELKAKDVSQG